MNAMRCETVRDRLPELANGLMSAAEMQAIRAHVAQCRECAAELELIEALRAEETFVPFGLERRVIQAVRAGRTRRTWSPTRVAMAATVVFALVTAGLLVRGNAPWGSQPVAPDEITAIGSTGLPGPSESMVTGGPALHNLSDEQLEKLLRELGS
jgi:anti-sigma factor RsiW